MEVAQSLSDRRVVSPPKDEWNNLNPPLESSVRSVCEFLYKTLPVEWEIYVRPFLNGLRPDIVLLNPNTGIAIFQVVDLDLEESHYSFFDIDKKTTILQRKKDGKVSPVRNPLDLAKMYRDEIYDLYCPRLKKRSGIEVIFSGVINMKATNEQMDGLFREYIEKHLNQKFLTYPTLGKESISTDSFKKAVPFLFTIKTNQMSTELAKDFKNWLNEPQFAYDDRKLPNLDSRQNKLVNDEPGKTRFRRIKGPAGSGKSVILAGRAAKLLSEDKTILVISYNITLLQYIRSFVFRWLQTEEYSKNVFTKEKSTYLNFHFWCKRICYENGGKSEYKNLDWKNLQHVLNEELPRLVNSIIESDSNQKIPKYHAIFVDEGQDINPTWWNVLKKMLTSDGEMMLVVDKTQDIYGTADNWTDNAMNGAGFIGPWNILGTSYRLPNTVADYASDFAKNFLPDSLVDLPKKKNSNPSLFCKMRWRQTSKNAEPVGVCVEEIKKMITDSEPHILVIPDIVFITDSTDVGLRTMYHLNELNIKNIHTFYKSEDGIDQWRESRRLKMSFFMGSAKVKATTIHCFKGWESSAIVFHLSKEGEKSKFLLYTGITRLKQEEERNPSFLTVVSSVPEFHEYGKTWSDYDFKD